MPWCPKCKAEYREGITVCSDCDIELVESLEEETEAVWIPFFESEQKSIADKLIKYFEYSGVTCNIQYEENQAVYIISVPEKQEKQAKKLYQAFYFVERERIEKGGIENTETMKTMDENEQSSSSADASDELWAEKELRSEKADLSTEVPEEAVDENSENYELEEEESEPALYDEFSHGFSIKTHKPEEPVTYVMKADQFKDYSATVWTFLTVGVIGLIVVILNVAKVFTFLYGPLPNGVMGGLFLFFIYIGLSTQKKAKKIQAEIEEEDNLTSKINQWLKDNVTDEFLNSVQDESISPELNYIKTSEIIRDKLIENFGSQKEAYLDRLIEEFYSATYDDITDTNDI